MGSLNVNRSVSDAFYRYKMPRLCAKVEGKGNGIKTVIVNMVDVAKALGRPATYPTKYFGCELGAQTQFDFKNERFIVNGSHDSGKLQDLLDVFIRKFVLCPECDNPETDLLVSAKKGTISQGCKACGFHGPLEFNHKLNTFILKNPPNLDPAVQGSSLTEGKKRSKRSKKGAENGVCGGANGGTNESAGGEGGGLADSLADAGDHHAADDKDEDGDEEWAVDVSEEAVRARMLDLTDGAKGMTISDDLEKSEKERMDIFYELVKRRREQGALEALPTHKELVAEADRLEIKSKATLVLAELLFSAGIISEVRRYRALLLRFTHDDPKAQRYLLGGLEQIVSLHKDTLLNKVPGILKLFYDADILEEKALLEWSGKVSKKYISKELSQEMHTKAEPFIRWLREAEEEDSDSEEDEEDDDLEIEYNDRAKVSPLKDVNKTAPAAQKAAVKAEDAADDFDIDAI